jgi:hypothetical protein
MSTLKVKATPSAEQAQKKLETISPNTISAPSKKQPGLKK